MTLRDEGKYREVMNRLTVTAPMRERILTNIRQADFTGESSGESGKPHRILRLRTLMRVVPAAAAILIALVALSFQPILTGKRGGTENSGYPVEARYSAQKASDGAADIDGQNADLREGNPEAAAEDVQTEAVVTGRKNFGTSDQMDGVGGSMDQQIFASTDELSAAVGFVVSDLSGLPFSAEDSLTEYSVLAGDTAQIVYTGADGQQAVFRKAEGTDDVSGDDSEYPESSNVTLTGGASGSVTAVLKGESADALTLAVWTDGDYSFSISMDPGMTQEEWTEFLNQNFGRE